MNIQANVSDLGLKNPARVWKLVSHSRKKRRVPVTVLRLSYNTDIHNTESTRYLESKGTTDQEASLASSSSMHVTQF